MIHQIVGAASTKEAATVGANAHLTYGNEPWNTKATAGLFMELKRESEVNKLMTCEEYREKCLNETIQKIEDSIKKKKESAPVSLK